MLQINIKYFEIILNHYLTLSLFLNGVVLITNLNNNVLIIYRQY